MGVRRLLAEDCVVEGVATAGEALELIRDVGDFDVAIVDMRPPNGGRELGGQDAIRALSKVEPLLGIVARGGRPERHLATAAMQAGASAYVAHTSDTEHLREAVLAALDNRTFLDPELPPRGSRGRLTGRQRQILQMLADGGSIAHAARELELSEETVKTHTKNILGRLGARNRVHAAAIALRESLID